MRFNKLEFRAPHESKAIASFLGLLLGDCLGAFTEFLDFDVNRRTIVDRGFDDIVSSEGNKKLVNVDRKDKI